jgi:hypothetical protein
LFKGVFQEGFPEASYRIIGSPLRFLLQLAQEVLHSLDFVFQIFQIGLEARDALRAGGKSPSKMKMPWSALTPTLAALPVRSREGRLKIFFTTAPWIFEPFMLAHYSSLLFL